MILRSVLVDNSFNVKLSGFEITGFYDNEATKEGIKKLFANIHQSALYTSEISTKMLHISSWILAIGFIVVVTSLFLGFGNSLFSLLVLKIWLSYVVVGHYLELKHLSEKSNYICHEAKRIWAYRLENGENGTFIADALAVSLLYETTLSESEILLSTKIKNKYNDQLEEQWIETQHRYELAE